MYLMSASLNAVLISLRSQTPESLRMGLPLASHCCSPAARMSCHTALQDINTQRIVGNLIN